MASRSTSAIDAFIHYMDVWGGRDAETLARIREIHLDKLTGIGTAEHQIFRTLQEMEDEWRKEVEQITEEKFHIKWIEEEEVDTSISIVNCELVWKRQLRNNTNVSVLHRVSTVWKKQDGQFRIVHWHSSAPDGADQHEIFPGSDEPKLYEDISILFCDFAGFTRLAAIMPPKELVTQLNELFLAFDNKAATHGLTKIKSIGDAYMLASGLSDNSPDHAQACIEWSLDVLEYLEKQKDSRWNLRVGTHSGNAIGGTIGQERPPFDLWGDSVNVASRLESAGIPGRINISENTYNLVKTDPRFEFESRGLIQTKGKGKLQMYFVVV